MSEKKQKSILSFFNRTPNAKATPKSKPSTPVESKSSTTEKENKSKVVKRLTLVPTEKKRKKEKVEEDVDEDEDVKLSRRSGKRRRAIIESDSDGDDQPQKKTKGTLNSDDDDDFKPPGDQSSSEDEMETSVVESDTGDTLSEPEESPKKAKRPAPAKTAPRKANLNSTLTNMSAFNADDDDEQTEVQFWAHEKLEWLKPDKIRDAAGNRPEDENYNPTTIKVPESYITSLTPGMGNWWKIKSRNFDVVIFYKVGKFYELYHMDAMVGVANCGLTFMKGKFAHAGFPEMRFDHFGSMLVNKGFKVARVEQTETQEANKERVKDSKDWVGQKKKLDKLEKQTRREVCRIMTPGTRVASMNGYDHLAASEGLFASVFEEGGIIGIALVDVSQGEFTLGEFTDDSFYSNLRTLLSQRNIAQLIRQKKGTLCPNLHQVLEASCNGFRGDPMPNKAYLSVEKSKKMIREIGNENTNLDKLLELIEVSPVGARALGGLLVQLKRYEIIHEVLRTSKFVTYEEKSGDEVTPAIQKDQKMVLDAMTLANLEVTAAIGASECGSLLKRLDTCSSPGGKRRLWELVVSPPAHIDVIRHRQESIKMLMKDTEFCSGAKKIISKLPDLTRLISRFGNLSYGVRPDDHPDKRAVMYEELLYNRQKTQTFCKVLDSFNQIQGWINKTAPTHEDLMETLGIVDNGAADISDLINDWKDNFDMEKAKKEGKLTPKEGTNKIFDNAVEEIAQIKKRVEEFRAKTERKYGHAKNLKSGKMHFVMEVKATVTTPDDWSVVGQRKGFKKYICPEFASLNVEMDRSLNVKDTALYEASSVIFNKFYSTADRWLAVVKLMDQLDASIALANYGHTLEEFCFPEFVEGEGVLNISSGKHPTVTISQFIPNDLHLGEGSKCVLLTGPNMGGKSTILRQVGLLTILAHYGCAVPAESMELSPVDRIFTRLGSSDRMLAGESTFMVEMAETSSILKSSTRRSLLLLDELGRGTATHDGSSIAQAVLEDLAAKNVRCLFSTHYHSLSQNMPQGCVAKHMQCHVEKNENGIEQVTFLYVLGEGAASKSHGFHAARTAGIPEHVVEDAQNVAKELQILHKGLEYLNAVKNNVKDLSMIIKGISL